MQRDRLRQAVCIHFGNPRLQRWKQQNGFTVFAAMCQTQLLAEARVIVAIVDDRVLSNATTIDTLQWINFQTRTIPVNAAASLPSFAYDHRGKGVPELDTLCSFQNETNEYVEYVHPELIFHFRILKNTQTSWVVGSPKVSLRVALDTFACELRFQ